MYLAKTRAPRKTDRKRSSRNKAAAKQKNKARRARINQIAR